MFKVWVSQSILSAMFIPASVDQTIRTCTKRRRWSKWAYMNCWLSRSSSLHLNMGKVNSLHREVIYDISSFSNFLWFIWKETIFDIICILPGSIILESRHVCRLSWLSSHTIYICTIYGPGDPDLLSTPFDSWLETDISDQVDYLASKKSLEGFWTP